MENCGSSSSGDNSLLCLFVLNNNTFSTRLSIDCSLYDLKNEICRCWSQLTPLSIQISYVLEDKVIMVDTDSDIQSIICFQLYKKSSFFGFTVKVKGSELEYVDGASISSSSVVRASSSSTVSVCSNVVVNGKSYLKDMLRRGSTLSISNFVGFCFGGAEQFREFLMAYQIQKGYELVFLKNCATRVTVICSSYKDGCLFKVHGSCDSGELKRFFMRNLVFDHSCGAGLRHVNNPHISSSFVKSMIIDEIRDCPSKKPKDIIVDFKREYNFQLSYGYAYHGKQLALMELHGNDALSYNDLSWYLEAVKKSNPDSYVDMDVDPCSNEFERVVIGFGACLLGFKSCRPMIFLDATHLKGRPGVLMGATAKNGDQGFFPLAMSVVSVENVDNWTWFLNHLKQMLQEERTLVFMSDRHQGLLSGVRDVFPSDYHSYCYLHMEQNLLSAVKAKNANVSIVDLFKMCSRASNLYEFEGAYSKFCQIGGVAGVNFLKDKPFDKWVDLFFPGKRYGEYSSNVAESFNSWILNERTLPITLCLDGIRVKIMEQMARRREECRLWRTSLCPSMELRLDKLIEEGFGWDVYKSSNFAYEVKSPNSHCVDLKERVCSCNQWKITGFPCAHAIKCMNKSKLSVYDFVEKYFTVDAYRCSYANAINPIPNYDRPIVDGSIQDVIKPPKEKRGAGRPSIKRKGGFSYFQNKQNRCGECKQFGHNKRNCQASKRI